jgi:hypothetical protein
MKAWAVVLFGAMLFGQAQGSPTPPTESSFPPGVIPSTVASGSVATVAIGVIWWILRHFTDKEERKDVLFAAAIKLKDEQILGLLRTSQEEQAKLASRYEALVREMRDDNRTRDGQWVGVTKEMTAALEHVSMSMRETREAMTEIKRAVEGLDKRITGLEGTKGRRGGE